MSNAPATHAYWWEDFTVGSTWPYGPYAVTRDEILEFARRYDPQPFHLDDAAAEQSLFKKLSASGWHTCAMTMRMMCDAYLLRTASLGSPGLESIKWHQPVYPGDVLEGAAVVLEARLMNSKPHVGLVHLAYQTRNQDGTTVLTMDGWGMTRQRAAA